MTDSFDSNVRNVHLETDKETLKSLIAHEMADFQHLAFAASAIEKSGVRIIALETSLARLTIEKENLLNEKTKNGK
jgi:hypothetical protein